MRAPPNGVRPASRTLCRPRSATSAPTAFIAEAAVGARAVVAAVAVAHEVAVVAVAVNAVAEPFRERSHP